MGVNKYEFCKHADTIKRKFNQKTVVDAITKFKYQISNLPSCIISCLSAVIIDKFLEVNNHEGRTIYLFLKYHESRFQTVEK